MAVPEEGHAFRERRWRAQHPVEPPADEVLRLDRLVLCRVVRAGEDGRLRRFRLDQTVDGLLEPVLHRLLVLGGCRTERRAAEEMRDLRLGLVERRDPVDAGGGGGLGLARYAAVVEPE